MCENSALSQISLLLTTLRIFHICISLGNAEHIKESGRKKMCTKGSYSYSLSPCFSKSASQTHCFVLSISYMIVVLYLPRKITTSWTCPLKRGGKEYDTHCMTDVNSSALFFLMYKPTVVCTLDVSC